MPHLHFGFTFWSKPFVNVFLKPYQGCLVEADFILLDLKALVAVANSFMIPYYNVIGAHLSISFGRKYFFLVT